MTRDELQKFADDLLSDLTRLTAAVTRKRPMGWWTDAKTVDAAIRLIEEFVP